MKTISAKGHEVQRDWYLVDAADKTLGRLASQIAIRLRGKHKPIYTQHVDTGDYIVVINAEKVRVTGSKARTKEYFHHTQHPGGATWTSYERMSQKHPERIIERAVKGMMPRTRLGRAQLRKLKVYVGTNHPHDAQQPVEVQF